MTKLLSIENGSRSLALVRLNGVYIVSLDGNEVFKSVDFNRGLAKFEEMREVAL